MGSWAKLAAKTLLNDEDAAERLEDEIGHLSPSEIDGSTAFGMLLGASRGEIDNLVNAQAAEGDAPVFHARERELQDDRLAIHCWYSDPNAQVYRGDQSVLVRSEDNRIHEEPLGFDPGRIEYLDNKSMLEWVVYPDIEESPDESEGGQLVKGEETTAESEGEDAESGDATGGGDSGDTTE